MAEKRGLGRGLSALIGDAVPPSDADTVDRPAGNRRTPDQVVPVEMIEPNPDQPRRDFDEAELSSLAASIQEKGILQPLLVRRVEGRKTYQIVAGERRWRAAQKAQLHEVPVLIRDYSDEEVLEIAIIENIQRSDLNPVEEAQGYQQLMSRFGHTQEQLAQALSKSRSHIANQMRLLSLPDDVLTMLRRGDLSAGHARAIITAEDPSSLARVIVARGLSVREAEKLAKAGVEKPAKVEKKPAPAKKDADTLAIEGDLSATLGMKVSIDHSVGEAGQMTIRYKSLDDLDRLCQALSSVDKLAR